MLMNLDQITPSTLDKQICATLWRNEIEEDEFLIRFLERPLPEFERSITSYNYYDDVQFDVNELRRKIHTLS